jgi:hypothetical protein
MGTRALQLVMVFLLAGCLGWASAIFFGPWAMTKYLESQVGEAIEVSGLKVTPKLAVTASRVQMSGGGAVTGSLRGVEVDWRLLTGDEPAVLVSVASGDFSGSLTVEDLQVILTQAENGEPLKVSGTAARAGGPKSVSAADVTFEAHTDYNFQLLSSVTVTTGELTAQYLSNATASTSQIEVDQVGLAADLMRQDLSVVLALTDIVVGGSGLSAPEADIKFVVAGGLVSLLAGARDLLSETLGVAVGGLTVGMEYDAASARLAGPIDLGLTDFSRKDIQLPAAEARVTLGDDQVKVSAQGAVLGSEINLGRRYIGRAPDASFDVEADASSVGGNLQVYGGVRLAAAQHPTELDVSFQGAVADVDQLAACMSVACEISDVLYEYELKVAGETLNGTSRCPELTCSSGGRTHDISTADTNKFFANLQSLNLVSPLILGVAYAQMLQGAAVGAGHKINF